MKNVFPAVFTQREQGRFDVRFPDLPGCVTSGSDLNDAIDQAKDAANAWLCSTEDHREQLPTPSALADIALEAGAFTTFIQVDTLAYRKLTDTHAVRKSVSLPAWMANMADQRGVNCSQVLQDALRSMFERG